MNVRSESTTVLLVRPLQAILDESGWFTVEDNLITVDKVNESYTRDRAIVQATDHPAIVVDHAQDETDEEHGDTDYDKALLIYQARINVLTGNTTAEWDERLAREDIPGKR